MRELAASPQVVHTLTVLSGPDRGSVYKLISGRITIGRGAENTIVIHDDPKVSRQHALVVVGPNSVQITDSTGRDRLIVNNQVAKSCELQSGAIIQIGDTKLMFKAAITNVVQETSPEPIHQDNLLRPQFPKTKAQGNRPLFYTILGTVVLLIIWMASQKGKKADSGAINGDTQIQSTIKTDQKIVNDIEAERMKNGMNTRQYQEADRQFIQGFREYEKGQYSQAIASFEACMTLFPNQQAPLYGRCYNYLQLSQTQFQELIQYELQLGSEYKAQGQYSACVAAYRNVMFMVNQNVDSDRKIFDLARAGHDACIALGGQDD